MEVYVFAILHAKRKTHTPSRRIPSPTCFSSSGDILEGMLVEGDENYHGCPGRRDGKDGTYHPNG